MLSDRFWIGTSWKMNKTLEEALAFTADLENVVIDHRIQPFLIPPFTSVRQVKNRLKHRDIKVGAQNMHWAEAGAWTGEISPAMLVDCQLDIVEIGHSERRTHFGETNDTVGLKTEAAVRHGLIPLVCIGETERDKETGHADFILEDQVTQALQYLNAHQVCAPILFAYEPVWAIGEHGKPATPEYANERHRHIVKLASNITGQPTTCLYGGSVNLNNAADLIQQPWIHGLFIGRSAWDAKDFIRILEVCSNFLNEMG